MVLKVGLEPKNIFLLTIAIAASQALLNNRVDYKSGYKISI
jgi:hypothetical protein